MLLQDKEALNGCGRLPDVIRRLKEGHIETSDGVTIRGFDDEVVLLVNFEPDTDGAFHREDDFEALLRLLEKDVAGVLEARLQGPEQFSHEVAVHLICPVVEQSLRLHILLLKDLLHRSFIHALGQAPVRVAGGHSEEQEECLEKVLEQETGVDGVLRFIRKLVEQG